MGLHAEYMSGIQCRRSTPGEAPPNAFRAARNGGSEPACYHARMNWQDPAIMREIFQKAFMMAVISLIATVAVGLASRTNAFHDLNLRAYDLLVTNKPNTRP